VKARLDDLLQLSPVGSSHGLAMKLVKAHLPLWRKKKRKGEKKEKEKVERTRFTMKARRLDLRVSENDRVRIVRAGLLVLAPFSIHSGEREGGEEKGERNSTTRSAATLSERSPGNFLPPCANHLRQTCLGRALKRGSSSSSLIGTGWRGEKKKEGKGKKTGEGGGAVGRDSGGHHDLFGPIPLFHILFLQRGRRRESERERGREVRCTDEIKRPRQELDSTIAATLHLASARLR